MKRIFFFFLTVSILANLTWLLTTFFSYEIDNTPPWHPFELNANISVEALVDNGYQCVGMPCGQVMFAKTIEDTTIQYEVRIDSESYIERHYGDSNSEEESHPTTEDRFEEIWRDEAIILNNSLMATNPYSRFDQRIKDNPYFPFKYDEVKNSYQNITWRIYQIKPKRVDSLYVYDFVSNYDCIIVSEFNNKLQPNSRTFLVYNISNSLYYECNLYTEKVEDEFVSEWVFDIKSDIPYLDQKRINLEKERLKEKNNQVF